VDTLRAKPSSSLPFRVRRVLRRADAIDTWQQATKTIDRLSMLINNRPSARVERKLIELRLQLVRQILNSVDDPVDEIVTIDGAEALDAAPGALPETTRNQLNVDVLKRGVRGNGALIVRGLFGDQTVSELHDAVISAFDSYDRWSDSGANDPTDPWFNLAPIATDAELAPRSFNRHGGGVFAFDSPRAAHLLTKALVDNGIRDLAAQYLGAPPILTIEKTTLRMIEAGYPVDNGWHQDGAFMGPENPALNIWIALTQCGEDAPSMKFVPHRLSGVVPTGTEGAAFSWSVSPIEVDRALNGVEAYTPNFMPGDAIFFDEVTLHSTSTHPSMTKRRLAIEAWMFGARRPAYERLPLLL
jgi:hypothetical protein